MHATAILPMRPLFKPSSMRESVTMFECRHVSPPSSPTRKVNRMSSTCDIGDTVPAKPYSFQSVSYLLGENTSLRVYFSKSNS
ncbi:hypothetical protein BDP55DRAFT_324716 [Colletotrichum godetiae]|uniref:Uncharacterized protein n=1 Tax=Colletotrichum godetiae TaxID=1209918 RepID=A0AAJ0ABH4_9PEZI|nr:uncharacterized protein BDP55DRAFT_324716 [Colletotrichum godetiae]KAK1660072.1 hypothetical protein BDP55DRAFT_324716 [Colletotrichum godetiae]